MAMTADHVAASVATAQTVLTEAELNRLVSVALDLERVPIRKVVALVAEIRRLREALVEERMGWGTAAGMMSDEQIPAERERVRQWLIRDGILPPE